MADSRVIFDIIGNDKASGAFSSAGRSAETLGSKVGDMGKKAAIGLAVGTAAAGLFAVKLGKDAVDAASNMQETLSKSNTVFGSSAGEIEKWSRTAARSFGQSQQSALEAAGTFGNLFVQLGVGAAEAAKMSKAQVQLASDFASFHNTSPEEAIEAMTAAYRGEYDAVQRYVPTINAAAVEQKALAMGLAGSTKELTAQDKALAVNILLTEGAGDAQDDFARTSDGLANKQRILSAVWGDAQVVLGEKLLPVITTVTGFLADNLPGALDVASRAFSAVGDAIAPVVAFLRDEVVPRVKEVVDAFGDDGLGGAVSKSGDIISSALPTIQAKLGQWVSAFVDWVAEVAPPLLLELGKLYLKVAEWIYTVALPAIIDQLLKWGAAFVDWVGPKIGPLLTELGILLTRLGSWIIDTALPAITTKIGEWASAFVTWVAPKIGPLLAELGTLLVDVGEWILTTALPNIIGKLADWAAAFVDWVAPLIDDMLIELGLLLARLTRWIAFEALPAIILQLDKWADAFVFWLVRSALDLPARLRAWMDTLAKWVAEDGAERMKEQGTKMGLNFVNGVILEVKKLGKRMLEEIADLPTPTIAFKTAIKDFVGDGPGRAAGGSALNRVKGALTAGTYVTSTYRSPAQNAAVGGSPRSYHLDRANPAVDIGGSTAALNILYGKLRAIGGWRELLWQVKGHYDHIHAANTGGFIPGGGPDQDSLLAMLTPGEFVFSRKSVKALGVDTLNRLHEFGKRGFNEGGPVDFLRNIFGSKFSLFDEMTADVKDSLADLARIPRAILDAVANAGRSLMVGDRSVAGFGLNTPSLNGTPRGWEPGKSWKDVGGVYVDGTVVVGDPQLTGSASVATHEFAHALDEVLGITTNPLLAEQLRQLQRHLGAGPGGNYYTQPGLAGLSETFAEALAQQIEGRLPPALSAVMDQVIAEARSLVSGAVALDEATVAKQRDRYDMELIQAIGPDRQWGTPQDMALYDEQLVGSLSGGSNRQWGSAEDMAEYDKKLIAAISGAVVAGVRQTVRTG